MTRIQAALSPQGAVEIPVVIPYESIFFRDHWGAITSCPWWYAESTDLAHQLAWQRDAIERIGQDWCALPIALPRELRSHLAIEVRGDAVFRIDRSTGGAERLHPPRVSGWEANGGVASVRPAEPPATRDELDAAIPPAQELDQEQLRVDGSADLSQALFDGPARGLAPLHSVSAPLWHTYDIWGFEGMMSMVAGRPDLVEYACERYLGQAVVSLRCSAALGARVIWIEDCMTDMVSPRAFARLNMPFLQAMAQEIRALGMWSIHYFCGNPAGKWNLLLSTGADALSLEEGKKGFVIDIKEVVNRVRGRMALLGNLDAVGVLQDATDAEMRAEIARQIAAGRRNGGRFIMSLGSPVTPGTPVERVRLYCEMAHALGTG